MRRLMLCAAVLLLFAASPVWGADTIKVGEIAMVTGDFAIYYRSPWKTSPRDLYWQFDTGYMCSHPGYLPWSQTVRKNSGFDTTTPQSVQNRLCLSKMRNVPRRNPLGVSGQ